MKKIRIGLNIVGGENWLAGVTILEMIVKAIMLLDEKPEMYLLVTDATLKNYHAHRFLRNFFNGIIFWGRDNNETKNIFENNYQCVQTKTELLEVIDVLFPLNSEVIPGFPAISWIPDFQHKYLPEYFSKNEILWRNEKFSQIAKLAQHAYFYSNAVEKDFRKFYPDSKCVLKNVFFRVLPDEAWFSNGAIKVREKYGIPEKFLICCNQFWIHKNHIRLFEALAILKKQGKVIHLVCTGNTNDYRHKQYFHKLKEFILKYGMEGQIHITGPLVRIEQIQLLRCSQFLVQPSLFEGFSLSVAECRALGKEVLLSDLPVHREHAYGILFNPQDSLELARKIDYLSQSTPSGPDVIREQSACIHAKTLATEFAVSMCDMFKEIAHGREVSHKLVIATSIAPHGVENQQQAIASWIQQGFQVVSLNIKEEIEVLGSLFPDVEFVEISRSAQEKYGKPFVYFDDFLEYFKSTGQRICGIVNSDVHLISGHNLVNYFSLEARDGLIFGSRIDVDHLDNLQGEMYHMGFDFFFFDQTLLEVFPKEEFCIGQPWWDYWMPIVPLGKEKMVKRLMTPIAYHVKHPINWNPQVRNELGLHMAKYIRTDVPVTEKNMISFLQYVCKIICEKAKKIEI